MSGPRDASGPGSCGRVVAQAGPRERGGGLGRYGREAGGGWAASGVRDWAAEEVETAQREQGRGLSAGLGLGFRGFGLDGFWGFPFFFPKLFPISYNKQTMV